MVLKIENANSQLDEQIQNKNALFNQLDSLPEKLDPHLNGKTASPKK